MSKVLSITFPRTGDGGFKGKQCCCMVSAQCTSEEAFGVQVPLSGGSWYRIISKEDAFTPEMLLSQLQEQDIRVKLTLACQQYSPLKVRCDLTCTADRNGHRPD